VSATVKGRPRLPGILSPTVTPAARGHLIHYTRSPEPGQDRPRPHDQSRKFSPASFDKKGGNTPGRPLPPPWVGCAMSNQGLQLPIAGLAVGAAAVPCFVWTRSEAERPSNQEGFRRAMEKKIHGNKSEFDGFTSAPAPRRPH